MDEYSTNFQASVTWIPAMVNLGARLMGLSPVSVTVLRPARSLAAARLGGNLVNMGILFFCYNEDMNTY